MTRSLWMVFVLFVALVCPGFAQTSVARRNSRNVQNCLDGLAPCDRSLLTGQEAQQIVELHHDRNLWTCLTGYGECNRSMLMPS